MTPRGVRTRVGQAGQQRFGLMAAQRMCRTRPVVAVVGAAIGVDDPGDHPYAGCRRRAGQADDGRRGGGRPCPRIRLQHSVIGCTVMGRGGIGSGGMDGGVDGGVALCRAAWSSGTVRHHSGPEYA